MRAAILLFILFIAAQLAGCGGGGGGGATVPPVTQATTALVTLSTAGSVPSGALIGDIDITLTLPAGVSIRSVPSAVNPAVLVPELGVVTLKGSAAGAASQSSLSATYHPGSPNRVSITLISGNGVTPAEAFATVNCDIAAGSAPLPAEFILGANIAPTGIFDLNAAALPNMTAKFSVAIN